MDILSYIDRKTGKIKTKAAEVIVYEKAKNYDCLVNAYCNLIRLCVEFTNSLKKEACSHIIKDDLDEGLSKTIEASYEIIGNVTKFRINSLLPIRIKGYHLYEREIIDKIYLSPLITLMHDNSARMYKEKVVICFIHHFKMGSKLIDHDNFEIKPIVDTIASILLIDDNPKYLSYYMDHAFSDEEYTEIYLVPDKEFTKFLGTLKGDTNDV